MAAAAASRERRRVATGLSSPDAGMSVGDLYLNFCIKIDWFSLKIMVSLHGSSPYSYLDSRSVHRLCGSLSRFSLSCVGGPFSRGQPSWVGGWVCTAASSYKTPNNTTPKKRNQTGTDNARPNTAPARRPTHSTHPQWAVRRRGRRSGGWAGVSPGCSHAHVQHCGRGRRGAGRGGAVTAARGQATSVSLELKSLPKSVN